MDKILSRYRKAKSYVFHKNTNKAEQAEKNSHGALPILYTAFDDSDRYMKTLVSKIENMIMVDYELISNQNVLDELENDVK